MWVCPIYGAVKGSINRPGWHDSCWSKYRARTWHPLDRFIISKLLTRTQKIIKVVLLTRENSMTDKMYDLRQYEIIHSSEDGDTIIAAVKQSAIDSKCTSPLEQNAYGLAYLASMVADSNRINNAELKSVIDLESDRIKGERNG